MKSKIKILHVVNAMEQGGIENWLMHLYRKVNKKKEIHFDFLVNTENESYFDKEIFNIGGKVLCGGNVRNPLIHFITMFRLLSKMSNYDAIHIHQLEGAISVFWAAKLSGNKNIIIHAHNDFNLKVKNVKFGLKCYFYLTKFRVNFLFKKKIAVSELSGTTNFGKKKYQYIALGEDFSVYKKPVKLYVRSEFNLEDDDIVISHVGSFRIQKNHAFLLKIIQESIKLRGSRVKCLLIGEGVLRQDCEEFVKSHNLQENVFFLKNRSDVAEILTQITDIFLFPSLYEGLGLAVVEAQAAGLPVLISDSIPNESIINRDLVKVMSLKDKPNKWAIELLKHHNELKDYDKEYAINLVMNSPFNIDNSINNLIQVWKKK